MIEYWKRKWENYKYRLGKWKMEKNGNCENWILENKKLKMGKYKKEKMEMKIGKWNFENREREHGKIVKHVFENINLENQKWKNWEIQFPNYIISEVENENLKIKN